MLHHHHRYHHHFRVAATRVARRTLCASSLPSTPCIVNDDNNLPIHHHRHMQHVKHHQYIHRSVTTTTTSTNTTVTTVETHRDVANHRLQHDLQHQQQQDLNIIFYNFLELLRTPVVTSSSSSTATSVFDVENIIATVHELSKREDALSPISSTERSDDDDGGGETAETAEELESLERVLFALLAKLLVQRNTYSVVESEIANDGTTERDWMERQLMDTMSLVIHCREAQQQEQQGSARVNWVKILMKTAGLLQFSPLSYGNGKRVGAFLELWLDLMVLRPLESIPDQRIRSMIEQIRIDLQEKENDKDDTKAAQLCAMVVDGILRHSGAFMIPQVMDITHKILNHSHIQISRYLFTSIIFKCRLSPRDKWDLIAKAHKKQGFLPHSKELSQLLLECLRQKDWNTARECATFIWNNGVTVDNAIAIRLLEIERYTRSVSDALQLWGSLGYVAGEHVKWDGIVINTVLTMCTVSKKNQFWQKVMREVLDRAQHDSGGQWPTAFFHTTSQKEKFIRTSKVCIALLNSWEERSTRKGRDTSYAKLANEWKRFMDDQLQRFGDNATEPKIKLGRSKSRKKEE